MARPSLAPLDRLEKLLGPDEWAKVDPTQAGARMEDASEHVRAYAGTDWLTAEGALDGVPVQVANVVAAMVERASRNPDGVTQEGAGPFTRSFGADAASRLYLTKGERLIVRRAAGRNSVGTLATSRGPLETADVISEWSDQPTLPDGWPQ